MKIGGGFTQYIVTELSRDAKTYQFVRGLSKCWGLEIGRSVV